jgi:hypothetical protein
MLNSLRTKRRQAIASRPDVFNCHHQGVLSPKSIHLLVEPTTSLINKLKVEIEYNSSEH